jgi:fructose-1,6-bisphosphatase/inositol monophosphatase family enzyme
VDCGYQTVTGAAGEVLLQLATFGSDDRKSQPKVSQTLQFDREASALLIDILRSAFPDIR